MKFLVLSLLVVACSALPQTYNYGTTSYVAQPSVFKQYGSVGLAAPKLNWGYSGNYLSSGFSGLSSGFLGNGFNLLKSGYAYAPAAQYAYAQPSIQYVQAAPAYQAIAVQPTVAVQKVAVAAQPIAIQAQTYSQAHSGPIPAAINQISRTVEYKAVPNVEQPINPAVIEVEGTDNPVHLHFKTRSSTLSVSQAHTPLAAPEVQTASAQDEPARLITEVQKPVIQEVKEVITPFRQVTQEINPVQESVHQVFTKSEGQRQQYVAQPYVPQQTQYAAVQQVAAPVSVAVAQPAVQAVAVEAAPVSVAVAQPAIQSVAVEAAPVAVATQVAAPAFSTGYSTGYSGVAVAKPSFTSSFTLGHASAPLATSSYLVQKPALIQKQIAVEKPLTVSSSYQTASGY